MNNLLLLDSLCRQKDIPVDIFNEISSYWEIPDKAARIIQRKWRKTEPRITLHNNVLEGILYNIHDNIENRDWSVEGYSRGECGNLEDDLFRLLNEYDIICEEGWGIDNEIEKLMIVLSSCTGRNPIQTSFHQHFTFELKENARKSRICGLTITQYNRMRKLPSFPSRGSASKIPCRCWAHRQLLRPYVLDADGYDEGCPCNSWVKERDEFDDLFKIFPDIGKYW